MRRSMRRIGVLVAVLAGVLPVVPTSADEPINASSTIAAVVVFPDRAMVTRRAEVKLEPGVHAVRLAPLPGTIEDSSVSAKGSGEAKVTLFGAKVVTTQLPQTGNPRAQELEKQLEGFQDKARQLQNIKEVLRQEREFLASIKAASSEQIGKEIVTKTPQAADVVNLVNVLDQQLTAVYQKDVEADVQLRNVAKEMDRVQRALAELRGASGQQETAIVVDLEADSAGRFTLEVSYRLPGATWQPAYEARANGQGGDVTLQTYGVVRQRTGEDWGDVSLSLSTARPAIGGRMPEIQPWWLRKMEYQVFATAGAVPMSVVEGVAGRRKDLAKSAPADYELQALEEKSDKPAQLAQAVAQTQGPAVSFTLPKAETVLSDWQPHKVAIATHALPAGLAYETTPKLSPYAYLRAKVKNRTELIFLPGDVQVFLDGAFVSSSALKLVAPSEAFDLFLGVDERIRVERKPLKAKVDVSVIPGLHGQTKTIDYEYVTTIQNFRSTPASVTVIDQLPVSQHDEIKVEQIVFDPKPTEEDKEKPGVVRWQLALPAGGKQAIRLSYRVKHPVDFQVEGL